MPKTLLTSLPLTLDDGRLQRTVVLDEYPDGMLHVYVAGTANGATSKCWLRLYPTLREAVVNFNMRLHAPEYYLQ